MIVTDQEAPMTREALKRSIGVIEGSQPGPTLIFVGGIHGNEPSGILALQKAITLLESKKNVIRGKIYAIAGNLPALEKGVRYIDQDLNRMFTKESVGQLKPYSSMDSIETKQKRELLDLINYILDNETGPFYFFDLHTTSGNTIPFLTVNDSLLNRSYTKQYPVPNVLGIEEFLEGPLLSYINELGYIAFGFEAGQHDSALSIQNHFAFIILSLVFSGCIDEDQMEFKKYYQILKQNAQNNHRFFEILFRHQIDSVEDFKMKPGYENFETIYKKQVLATSGTKEIKAPFRGQIFMPLYQGKGEDGFFIIRVIPRFFLWLSKFLRNSRSDRILVLLPGVSWGDSKKETLVVDRRIARFLAKDLFHLLGYRSKKLDKSHYIMKNRERSSRKNDYLSP